MKTLIAVGRLLIAIPMIAFGVQHFVYMDFVTRVFPRLPAWIPGHRFLATLFGAFLIAAGAAIITGKAARLAALVLGGALLLSFVLLYIPLLIANPYLGGLWTGSGKALAMAGGSFLVACSFPNPSLRPSAVVKALERFIPLSRFFLGAFLILCGVQHFIYLEFVATLVPSWIPGHLFWTCFTGVALIAGGIGIIIPMTARLAASMTAIMIFLWVVLLHIPRALADLHNSNETTAVFEALAMTGAAVLVVACLSAENKHLEQKNG
ncbi:MAG: hypothetical protein WBV94_31610 [Blastocatellia bacterium]